MEKKKEQIKRFFDKTSYLWQFIITILFAIMAYQFISIKTIFANWHNGYFIGSILTGGILLVLMGYQLIRDKKEIAKLFVNVSILLGILYMTFMIPSQAPDEQVHMMKAYEVSKGILVTPKQEDGSSSTVVPEDLMRYNHNIMNKYSILNEQFSQKTDYQKTQETVSSAQGYSFILYIVPAVGLFIARNLGINLIGAIYFAKLLNLLFFIILGYLSIKKIPFGKIVLAVYLLMPMMLQQAVAITADVFINAISIYFIAYIMDLLYKQEKITKKQFVLYCVLSALLGIAKIVYMPLVGIGLLFIFRKNVEKKDKIIFITISIVVALFFSLQAYITSTKYTTGPESMEQYKQEMNVDSQEQLSQILKNPFMMVKVLIKDLISNGHNYITMAVGSRLGWLTICTPSICISLYVLLLLWSVLIENHQYRINLLEKGWILLICLGIVVLTQLAMYISFTPVGATFIGGVQGRYFIPILILPLLCFCRKENYIKTKYPEATTMIVATIINLLVLYYIYSIFR